MWVITGVVVIVFTGSSLPPTSLLLFCSTLPPSLFPFPPTTAISHPVAFLASVNAVLKRTHAVDSTAEDSHPLDSLDASPTLTAEDVIDLASGHVPEMGGLVASTYICLNI